MKKIAQRESILIIQEGRRGSTPLSSFFLNFAEITQCIMKETKGGNNYEQ
jgi:hypothetical protein